MSLLDPSDEAAEAARTGSRFHQAEIASLDAKISSLLDAVATLREQRDKHQYQLQRCQSVLTLARRLPPEMLGQIFEHCVKAYPSAPVVLSHVCAAWRSAAICTPQLWSRLYIDCSLPQSAEKAAHWVHMSSHHIPLHITLLIEHNAYLLSVMRVLLPHASRWKELVVDAELPSHVEEVLRSIQADGCSLSNIEKLDLDVREELHGTLGLRTVFDMKTSPRLHTVRFLNFSWNWVAFPAHIIVLELFVPVLWLPPPIFSQTVEILRGLPELQTFSLVFPDRSFSREALETIGDITVTMQHLRSVTFTGCYPLFEVLAHLTLPSLRYLCLRETGIENTQTARLGPSFLGMIERSSPPVEILEFHDIDITDGDFIRCLKRLPTLEGISLHESEISNAVFKELCFPLPNEGALYDPPSWICPQLKRLDLRWCSQLSGRVLVELVEARLAAPQTIRISEVVAINCSSVREDDVISLAKLTLCCIKGRAGDFCGYRGCCTNNRYRHRFMLRHAAELREELGSQRRGGDVGLDL